MLESSELNGPSGDRFGGTDASVGNGTVHRGAFQTHWGLIWSQNLVQQLGAESEQNGHLGQCNSTVTLVNTALIRFHSRPGRYY